MDLDTIIMFKCNIAYRVFTSSVYIRRTRVVNKFVGGRCFRSFSTGSVFTKHHHYAKFMFLTTASIQPIFAKTMKQTSVDLFTLVFLSLLACTAKNKFILRSPEARFPENFWKTNPSFTVLIPFETNLLMQAQFKIN